MNAVRLRAIRAGCAGACLCALLGACRGVSESAASAASGVSPAWRVAFAGCDLIIGERGCGIEAQRQQPLRLTLFIDGSEGEPVIRAPARLAGSALSGRAHDTGRQYVLTLTAQDQALELASADARSFRLSLVALHTSPVLRAAQRVASPAEARAQLTSLRAASEALSGVEKARSLAALARLHARAGDPDAADALRLTAARDATGEGLFALAAAQHFALAFSKLYRARDLEAAAAHLAAAMPLARDAESAADLAYYQGLLAQERSAFGVALASYARAAQLAHRIGQDDIAWIASQQRATLLGQLGSFDAALAEYEALAQHAEHTSACERAAFTNSRAWLQLRAADSSGSTSQLAAADAAFATARALFAEACAGGQSDLASVILNQAFSALLQGRLDAAGAYLAEIDAQRLRVPVYVELWRRELAARVALARGQSDSALRGYRALERAAAESFSYEREIAALLGQARALLASGQSAAAIAALERVQRALDHDVLRVPLGDGRGNFAHTREESASLLIELLLERGRSAAAIEVARRARLRPLWDLVARARLAALPAAAQRRWQLATAEFSARRNALEQRTRDRWQLPREQRGRADAERSQLMAATQQALAAALAVLADAPFASQALREPRAGELLLGFFPLSHGWFAFAQSASEHAWARLAELSDANAGLAALPKPRLASWLLAPFARLLAVAQSVRVLGYGELAQVDVHALPFQAQPLLAHVPVVYALDLQRPPPTAASQRRALLVADPTGDLPEARSEAQLVAAALQQRGFAIEPLFGFGATRTAVLAGLARSGLFHYAGHGQRGQREGLDSELPLADAAALSAADVLALPHVPQRVVLSACDTLRGTAAPVELGVGEAFVLAGATGVVAATRVVADATARALIERIYAAGHDEDLARALQRSAAELSRAAPELDWAAFRVLGD